MTTLPKIKLKDCCDIISGSTPRRNQPEFWNGDIAWVTPKDLSSLDQPVLENAPEHITKAGFKSCSTRLLPKGSILFSSRAPIGLVAITGREMCTNQGFKSLVPGSDVYSKYLYWTMRHLAPRIQALGNGATFKEVSKRTMEEFEIPLPPLSEQRRIAAILDKADAIRRKRAQTLKLADEFLKSTFLDMFGDPVTNPKGWESRPLSEMVEFVSGATPSKSNPDYWNGTVPWVSPKDMKVDCVADSIDHISESVFDATSQREIPEGAILIVIRGMILAHTVPIAMALSRMAINQDMKAMLTRDGMDSHFLLACLQAQHGHILSQVATAAHGTKRIEMRVLADLPITVPPRARQEAFSRAWKKTRLLATRLLTSRDQSEALFDSLTQRAFRGQLQHRRDMEESR